ncbi:MAG TPA: zf-HC2 domain-containing protein [Thermomicrobiaceae bacterium]|nr:zf-HC2 domain-containing protein [Thermomicrobiaceae bacterium]
MRRDACESIRPLISAYMDGELSREETRELHAHLAECPACSDLFDEYRDLREQLRDMPPTPPPPEHVRRHIRHHTVDHTPSRAERWFGLSAARLSFSAGAAVVLLLVVSALALVHGYQQGSQPAIASSQPTSGAFWPVQQPVEIDFSKPMDQASVDRNLKILPLGEGTRLPRSWRGNTLVIGASSSGGVPLLPNTDYTIVVLGTARDIYGNMLGQPWILRFHTSNVVAQATATPAATPSPTVAPSVAQVVATPAVTPSTPDRTAPASTAAPVRPTAVATAQPTKAPARVSVAPTAPPTPTPTPVSPTPVPTQTTASAAVTPAASPATPSAASGTPSPSTPSATPQTAVTGAFGSVYWASTSVQTALGNPSSVGQYSFSAAILSFQRGTMYERFDTQTIYIFFADGTWKSVHDTWTAADGNGGGQPQGQPNLWLPSKNFWKAWSADPSLVNSIGYATSPSTHLMQGLGQDFANGSMLYSDTGFVYVAYSNHQWQVFPDTSGHGDLLTPTPTGTGSSTPSGTVTTTPVGTATPAETPSSAVTPVPAASPTPAVSPTASP